MKIDPTATVSPGAHLADDVEIGPYASIGPDVTLGEGCVINARAVIEGRTTLGGKNWVGCGTVLGTPPQDLAFISSTESGLIIGDGNVFREYVTVHRGTTPGSQTRIGNSCTLLTGCHVGHNAQVGNHVTIANNCLLAGYVQISDYAVLGAGSVFHQFLRVGAGASVREGTRCVKDIPPFVSIYGRNLVSGLNEMSIRATDDNPETLAELERAFALVYRSNLNISQALAASRSLNWRPAATQFFAFIESSKRGICRPDRAASSPSAVS